MVSKDFLRFLSATIGWIYTFSWSISNVPQVLLHYKRKSVAGYSVTFQTLNTVGFTCYSIYTFYGFWFQHQHDMTRSIVVQDLLFAGVCSTLVFILTFQCYILYPKTITSGAIHPFLKLVMIVIVTLGIYNIILAAFGKIEWFSTSESTYSYSAIQFLGYCKSFISFIKYVPQVYLNYINQNTRGYHVANVLTDITGGSCSFLQMFINAFIDTHEDGSPDFSHIYSNVPKLLLSIESVVFDLIFMAQHYIIYRANNARIAKEEEQTVGSINENLLDGELDIPSDF